jgi:hypothetical protein
MTVNWTIRRCDQCGRLESDPNVELIIERRNGEPDQVVHVVAGGLRKCGVMVELVTVTS